MSSHSYELVSIDLQEEFRCTAIPDPDFDPQVTFLKLPASRLREMIASGLSPDLMTDLRAAIIKRIGMNPLDRAELETLLTSLPAEDV